MMIGGDDDDDDDDDDDGRPGNDGAARGRCPVPGVRLEFLSAGSGSDSAARLSR